MEKAANVGVQSLVPIHFEFLKFKIFPVRWIQTKLSLGLRTRSKDKGQRSFSLFERTQVTSNSLQDAGYQNPYPIAFHGFGTW